MRPLTFALALCLLAVLPAASASPDDPPEYIVHDLGSIDDRGETVAVAINDRGEIAGFGTSSSGLTVPFYWSAQTGFIKILDTYSGNALDINDKGQVVGWFNRNGVIVGFLWSRRGGFVELPLQPVGINDRGDIIGPCAFESSVACILSRGLLRELPDPDGAEVSSINDRGDVVGTVGIPGVGVGAAVWYGNDDSFTILEPTPAAGYNAVIGSDINQHRIVVGTVETFEGDARHPVLWDRNGVAEINASLFGWAIDINDRGVVIVQSEEPLAALAWDTRRMTVAALPSLGGPDRPLPSDINNRGEIVGVSNDGERNHAVLWEPKRK
jgi:uncharacterized membrane protein